MNVTPTRYGTVGPEEIVLLDGLHVPSSLMSFWERRGLVELAHGDDGTRRTEASNRFMGPKEIREVLEGRASYETDLAKAGLPFFHWFDREYLCVTLGGAVVYPETSPPAVVAADVEAFVAMLVEDPDFLDGFVERVTGSRGPGPETVGDSDA